jgi:hypothetical protein
MRIFFTIIGIEIFFLMGTFLIGDFCVLASGFQIGDDSTLKTFKYISLHHRCRAVSALDRCGYEKLGSVRLHPLTLILFEALGMRFKMS